VIDDPATAAAVHGGLEWLAMLVGARYYIRLRRQAGLPPALAGPGFAVLAGLLLGAGLGNKAVFWIEQPALWAEHGGWAGFLRGGQSLVGGLLGGLIGVEIAKKLAGVRQSTGDVFVFPILLGIMIGRVGCFLAGLHDDTYGLLTALPWGVDFGDGIRRHPTQLYEIAFAGLLWMALRRLQARCAAEPGLLFKLLLSSYLVWRLAVDGLKPVPYVYPLGLSGIQWVCLIALVLYLPLAVRQWKRLP
jgi:prolipoprotein diacylglyceryltransferase